MKILLCKTVVDEFNAYKANFYFAKGVSAVTDIQNLVIGLIHSDNKQAYQFLKILENESFHSAVVYPFFDNFVEMLSSTNSYVRTRGIILIAANAKWDRDYKIDEIIDKYLKHITDVKPITARQCIKMLPTLAKYKPDLKPDIENALHSANLTKYKESMQSLVWKDIQKCLADIQNL